MTPRITPRPTTYDADYIVVGSGAGGGQMAYTLAMEGARVLMLEAGRKYDPLRETAMFQTPDAAGPAWHRGRADTLMRDTQRHGISAVTDAWRRLASRHIATAVLLEQQATAAADDLVRRSDRFFR